MSIELMTRVFRMKVGNPTRKLILLKLADNANEDGICWPSWEYLMEACELSRQTLWRHMKELEAEGLIKREEVFDKNGRRKGTLYHVLPDETAGFQSETEGFQNGTQTIKNRKDNSPPYTPTQRATTFDDSEYGGRVPDEWISWAIEHGLSRSEAETEADAFTDYWRSAPGAKAKKKDWPATWRNWIRKHRSFKRDPITSSSLASDIEVREGMAFGKAAVFVPEDHSLFESLKDAYLSSRKVKRLYLTEFAVGRGRIERGYWFPAELVSRFREVA